jgi:hypothetical protein
MNTISPTRSLVFLGYAHWLTLCMLASWSHEGVVFLDFLPSPHLVTFSSSLIWAQLTLFVPAWGTRSSPLQDGAPIHRVRAHSLTGIRNSSKLGLSESGRSKLGRSKFSRSKFNRWIVLYLYLGHTLWPPHFPQISHLSSIILHHLVQYCAIVLIFVSAYHSYRS